jgi:hypothetical protein
VIFAIYCAGLFRNLPAARRTSHGLKFHWHPAGVPFFARTHRPGRQNGIKDFLVDDKTWEIRNLVVSLGRWGSAKDVLILPTQVERISWDESTVFVDLTS